MQIANVKIDSGALLAPMEAVTDLAFRTVCEELGAALTFTEFLSAEALTRGAQKAVSRMSPSLNGRTYVVQIFGREPNALVHAAQMAADTGAHIVDINMGCPAKRVTAGLCGSALMREPDLAAELVEKIRAGLPDHIPLTVKHRLGWDEKSVNAVQFAQRLVSAGAAMITVHGRTRSQKFTGEARLEPIGEVRTALPAHVPVIGNGDVTTLATYQRMKAETGCDAVMIGRAARGNPWLFREILAYENGENAPPEVDVAEKRRVWRRHAELVATHAPEKMRLHEIRKTMAWYSRGMQGGAQLRDKGYQEKTVTSLLDLGEVFFERLLEWEAQGPRSIEAPPVSPIEKALARRGRRSPELQP